MKKYIQPAIEVDQLLSQQTFMLTASDEVVEGGGGAGDAKLRDDEVEEILSNQKEGWEDGLW